VLVIVRVSVIVRRAATWACSLAVALLVLPAISRALAGGTLPVTRGLAGRVICIDAGHGGIDPGAVGPSGVLEKDINLEISRLLAQYLRSAGSIPVLTREGDEDPADLIGPPAGRRIDDLELRVQKARSSGSHVFISIHCNKFPSEAQRGAQTFYVSRGHPDSRRLAETIQEELKRVTGVTWREALGDSQQYVLRQMSIPAVTVEAGFLSNPEEERLLTQPQYRSRLAWAIFMGLAKFMVRGLSA
jgi:N-acetylmuramoyl-L-alanine amidase